MDHDRSSGSLPPAVSWLPDLHDLPIAELLSTQDPAIVAATERVVHQVTQPEERC